MGKKKFKLIKCDIIIQTDDKKSKVHLEKIVVRENLVDKLADKKTALELELGEVYEKSIEKFAELLQKEDKENKPKAVINSRVYCR